MFRSIDLLLGLAYAFRYINKAIPLTLCRLNILWYHVVFSVFWCYLPISHRGIKNEDANSRRGGATIAISLLLLLLMDIEILRSYRPQHLIPHRITSDVASALTTAADFTYTPDTARFHPKTDPYTKLLNPPPTFQVAWNQLDLFNMSKTQPTTTKKLHLSLFFFFFCWWWWWHT